jgi:hypothetical protein
LFFWVSVDRFYNNHFAPHVSAKLKDQFSAEPQKPVLAHDHQSAYVFTAQHADEAPQTSLGVVHARPEVSHYLNIPPASAGALDLEPFDLRFEVFLLVVS